MKVLFCNRANALSSPGGDTVQMMNTKKFLERQFPVQVEICLDPREVSASDAKLVHIFNLQTLTETVAFVQAAQASGKKVALSPIYWDFTHSLYVSALARYGVHSLSPLHRRLKPIFEASARFGHRGVRMLEYFSPRHRATYAWILQQADLVLPNSAEEEELLERYARVRPELHHVVPNGIDTQIFTPPQCPNEPGRTIVCVGRIEPLKNQLGVLRACAGIPGLRVILIGRVPHESRACTRYARTIFKFAAALDVEFIDHHLEQVQLSEILARADVHVLPSFRESPGLSTMEALALGLSAVVASREYCPVETYFSELLGKRVFACDPYDVRSIRAAIVAALASRAVAVEAPSWRDFSWSAVARATYEGYLRLPTT